MGKGTAHGMGDSDGRSGSKPNHKFSAIERAVASATRHIRAFRETARRAHRPSLIEALEQRRLLSVSFNVSNNYAVGASAAPLVVAGGDFNNDGIDDLVTANSGSGNVTVALGQGDGTFEAAINTAAGTTPGSLTIGRFDADVNLDLAVADFSNNRILVLRGNGDGTFVLRQTVQASSGLKFVTHVEDLTGDGRKDLVAGYLLSDLSSLPNFSVMAGQADGTFASRVDFNTNNAYNRATTSVTSGDFNGDAKTDLALMTGQAITVALGNGTGGFSYRPLMWLNAQLLSLTAGDMNHDGATDLVVVTDVYSNPIDTVGILINNGNASFTQTYYNAGAFAKFVSVADLDRQNGFDVAVVGAPNDLGGTVNVLLNHGDGTLGEATEFAVGKTPKGLAAGDFDGDGVKDLATANSGSNDVSVMMGIGDGTFHAAFSYYVGYNPEFITATGDFNEDGRRDLLVSTTLFGGSGVSILRGKADGSFLAPVSYSVGSRPTSIAVADFNADGHLDFATSNALDSNVSVRLGTGSGTFGTRIDYAVPGPSSVLAADFTGDGILDLYVSAFNYSTSVFVLRGNGDGTFQSGANAITTPNIGTDSPASVLGDFNADGKPDIARIQGHGYRVLSGVGNGTFAMGAWTSIQGGPPGYSPSPSSVSTADFNGDGKLDLVFAAAGYSGYGASAAIDVLLGNGKGTFNGIISYAPAAPDAYQFVTVADFNRDGLPDLATANWILNSVSVLLNKGVTTPGQPSTWSGFSSAASFAAGNRPKAVAAADFNGDGKVDLAAANSSSYNVTVLLQNRKPVAAAGGPYTVNPGGAIALNGKSSSDPDHDALTYTWDLDGDGNFGEIGTGAVNGNEVGATPIFRATSMNGGDVVSAVLRVTDTSGNVSDSSTTSITARSVALNLTIAGNAAVNEGTAYSLNLSADASINSAISSWSIDWGDGTAPQTIGGNPNSANHSFADGPNTYAINATATNGTVTYYANSLIVNVSNVQPTLNVSGAASVNEGDDYILHVSATDPGSDHISSWSIDWGDGSALQIVQSPAADVLHNFLDGSHSWQIHAIAIDEDGGPYSTAAVPVSVANVAPTITLTGASLANEGSNYTLNLAASDPGQDTISSWQIHWGDGSAVETIDGTATSASHVFGDGPNDFSIWARAIDEDGSYDSGTRSVHVKNIAPAVTLSGSGTVNEGASYTLTLNAVDPGADTISAWSINWGDGNVQNVTGNPQTVSHLYADGTTTANIHATPTDEDGTHVQSGGPVAMDATYGTNGVVMTALPEWGSVWGTATSPNGKTTMAASLWGANGQYQIFARYTSGGSLDTSFGSQGLASPVLPTNTSFAAMAVDAQDRTLLLGYQSAGSSYSFALVRLASAGAIDTTFGTNGLVLTSFGANSYSYASQICVQSDGKMLALGYTSGSTSGAALARYNANGTLDASFGTNGTKILSGLSLGLSSIALQPDGKIILGGSAWIGDTSDPGVVRLNSNGSIDTTFGNAGQTIASTPLFNESPTAVAVDGSGRIVVGGSYYSLDYMTAGVAAVRFSANGTLDATYGTAGNASMEMASWMQGGGMSVSSDGTVTLGGMSPNYVFGLGRFRLDGTPDASFGINGLLSAQVGYYSYVVGLSQSPDGKLLAAGFAQENSAGFGLARFTAPNAGAKLIDINNVEPTLTIAGDATVVAGATYTLHLASTDPGADTIDHWTIHWGDNSDPDGNGVEGQTLSGNPSTVTHVYAHAGTMTISAMATDEDVTDLPATSVLNVGVALATPTNLTAPVVSSSQITLAWQDNSNEENGYQVQISTDGINFGTVAALGAGSTGYATSGLAPGTQYWFRVRATSATGPSANSNIVSATTLPSLPAAPTGVSARVASRTSVDVSWIDNATNESGYIILYSTDGGQSFTVGAIAAANAIGAVVNGLPAASSLLIRVVAQNAGGDSPITTGDTFAISTPSGLPAGDANPPPPSDFMISGATEYWYTTYESSLSLQLQWVAHGNPSKYHIFEIYQGDAQAISFGPSGITFNQSTYTKSAGLLPETTYSFAVHDIEMNLMTGANLGTSQFSNIAYGTTLGLAAPTHGIATRVGEAGIRLEWQDNSQREDHYRIDYIDADGNAQVRYGSSGIELSNLSLAQHADFQVRTAKLIDGQERLSSTLNIVLPTVFVQAPDNQASEDGNTARFTFTRNGEIDRPLTVAFSKSGTTNPTDYQLFEQTGTNADGTPVLQAFAGSTITIPAGSATNSKTLWISPFDDVFAESTESLVLTLVPHEDYLIAGGGGESASVSILDNEPSVSVAATDANAAESGTPATDTGKFTFTRNGSTDQALTVGYTIAGSAGAGDYVALPATIVIPAGAASAQVHLLVKPTDDEIPENTETVVLTLVSSQYYHPGSPTAATVNIYDNEVVPTVTIVATDAVAAEDPMNSGRFKMVRDGPLSTSLTVAYTIGGTASASDHDLGIGGSVFIPIGQSEAFFDVTPTQDSLHEGPETVVATLIDEPSYNPGDPNSATVTIKPGDPFVKVEAVKPVATEPGPTSGTFRITRYGEFLDQSEGLTVTFVIGGDALEGSDYEPILRTALIPAGLPSVDVDVLPINDVIPEPDEFVTLTLSAGGAYGYVVGENNTATVKIEASDVLNLIVQGLPEESNPTPHELDPGATIPVNDNFDENGRDGQQVPVPDNDNPGVLAADPQLVDGQLLFRNGVGPLAGQWKLNYPARIKIYKGATNEQLYNDTWYPYDLPVPLRIEGISPSESLRDVDIVGTFKATGEITESTDHVLATVVQADLDVDSDNTKDQYGAPDLTEYEDRIEWLNNDPAKPGKVIVVNDDDDDNDGIPDFADGYNLDGNAGNNDDSPASATKIPNSLPEQFTEMKVSLSPAIDVTKAQLRFFYSSSNPASVIRPDPLNPQSAYALPASGSMRIWRKNGGVARVVGDLVQSSWIYTASELGLSDRVQEFYIEAVKPRRVGGRRARAG